LSPVAADSGPVELDQLERRIDYRFRSIHLLELAVTHRSWSAAQQNGDPAQDNNELLEFLGDSVLALRTSERLLKAFPNNSEGHLSRLRAWIVSARNLGAVAQQLELGRYLRLSRGEESIGGRTKERLLANALEALIGAIHSDRGYRAASRFIDTCVLGRHLETLSPEQLHEFAYKSALQEWSHAHGRPLPTYRVVDSSGPEHGKVFTVEVAIAGVYSGRATGRSKKEAEQKAAHGALSHLGLAAAPIAGFTGGETGA
jgi:ribonuclease-3